MGSGAPEPYWACSDRALTPGELVQQQLCLVHRCKLPPLLRGRPGSRQPFLRGYCAVPGGFQLVLRNEKVRFSLAAHLKKLGSNNSRCWAVLLLCCDTDRCRDVLATEAMFWRLKQSGD